MSGDKKLGSDIGKPVSSAPSSEGGKVGDKIDELKEFFDTMGHKHAGKLYERWRQHECAGPDADDWKSTPILNKKDMEAVDALRGLNSEALDDLAKRLKQVAKSAGALATDSKTMGKTLDDNWKSSSSSKAVEKFDDLKSASNVYKTQMHDLSTHVSGLQEIVNDIRRSIDNFAKDQKKGSGINKNYNDLGETQFLELHITRLNQAMNRGRYYSGWGNWRACYEEHGFYLAYQKMEQLVTAIIVRPGRICIMNFGRKLSSATLRRLRPERYGQTNFVTTWTGSANSITRSLGNFGTLSTVPRES